VAVVGEDGELTYGRLNARANRLARHLRTLGVGPEVLVGICVERSVEMVVGLLATLKAGGAYVPLDPGFPPERLAYMLEDSAAPVLLTQQRLLAGLPAHRARPVCIDRALDLPGSAGEGDLPCETGPANLAYVIYTSGSTGKPKGVQITHGSVVNFLHSLRREPGMTAADVVPAVTTLSFDIAVLEIFLPLVVGARAEIVSRQTASDGAALAALLARTGATVVQATPATWRLLLNAGWRGGAGVKILCGGEALPRPLADRLIATGGEVWNVYGPTETTVWSTVHRLTTTAGPVPIGRPIVNTQVYLLGPGLAPVAAGEAGELVIGGDGLARGYRHRPALTADKFIPDPFSAEPGRRLYRTGDLARFLPDGTLECLGRIDHQVKIRGYRIELGEVESVLAQHPSVREAVVVAREDAPGEKRLVAYLVPGYDQIVTASGLRRFLKGKLPEYMVPSAFVKLTALPLTPNGKVNRLALPAPAQRPELEREFVAPRDATEADLAVCWEEVLGVRPVGVKDSAFDLGMDSLRGVSLLTLIEKRTGKKLPPGSLFHAPTIEEMAALVRGRPATRSGAGTLPARWSSLVAIQPHGTKPPFFAVHGGAGTIFPFYELGQLLGPDQPFYGLQAQGLYGGARPHLRIEEMAAHYLKEMREVQPSGPYFLGGYCFGGIVAFEMAQRLVRQGEEVALLALFNAPSPVWIRSRNSLRSPRAARPPANAPAGQGTSPPTGNRLLRLLKKVMAAVRWSAWRAKRRLLGLVQDLRQWAYLRQGLPTPAPLRDLFIRINNTRAEVLYEPEVYPGPVVLFRAREWFTTPADPLLGWGGLAAGGVELYEVSGSHTHQRTLMHEPYIQEVADRLREYLAPLGDKVTRCKTEPLTLSPGHLATSAPSSRCVSTSRR
jgi:amino acid adenylation domain-containing protein